MNYSKLESTINTKFKNRELLENVFIHRSYLNEHKNFRLSSNEKLEFLGDSVLSLITSIYLYKNYPELNEGLYTDIKSAIVRTESLAIASEELNIGYYLCLSKGEEKGHGRKNKNILADCFEALIAAIFLEAGFDCAYDFVLKHLFKDRLKKIIEQNLYQSPKSKLQEIIQAKHKIIPVYKVLSEEGPEHKRVFTIGVYIENKKKAEGIGRTKKEAEEQAAQIALQNMI